MGKKSIEKAQFNIRIDADLLRRYKEFCEENGLDPQGQVVNFMRRIVESKFSFQEKLWEVLTKDMK
jgi:antitoxin component of RelBE/YafQ-DinJ toxin-antitoxin module